MVNDVKLPEAEYSVYGVDVVGYAGEPDAGVITAGHGRRSYAAINRAIRVELGRDLRFRTELGHNLQDAAIARAERRGAIRDFQKTITARWVVFVYTCGCTKDQHVEHDADDADCPCEYYGLPPCCDYYPSLICHASADTTGAIPVLEVLW